MKWNDDTSPKPELKPLAQVLRERLSRLAGRDMGEQFPEFFLRPTGSNHISLVEGVVESVVKKPGVNGKLLFMARQPVLVVSVSNPKKTHPQPLCILGHN